MAGSPRRSTARLAAAGCVALLLGATAVAAPAYAGQKAPDTNRTPDAVFDKPGAYTLDVSGRAAGGATVRVFGAQGANGGGGSPAGKGGGVTVRITLQAGEQLRIRVGGRGQQPSDGQQRNPGGFNGGGDGGIAVGHGGNPHDFWQFNGGSGGGASDIRRGGDALANRIVVAAGGGGGGANGTGVDGSGGADGGAPAGGAAGDTGGKGWTMHGGVGGSQTTAGDGGLAVGPDSVSGRGDAGKAGDGGNGGRAQIESTNENAGGSGGGGGGGYFGGGGGAGGPRRSFHPVTVYPGAGGGGGSSFAPPGAEFATGVEKGDGRVEIFFDASPHLASIDPSKPWSFRTQRVGTVSEPREVKVENKGTEPLVIESVSVRGSAPGDYKLEDRCTGKRIQADDTCTIEVRFAPTSLIPSIAAIVVRVNLPETPELQSLTGGAGTLADEQPDDAPAGDG